MEIIISKESSILNDYSHLTRINELGLKHQILVWSEYLWWNITTNFSDYTPFREPFRGTCSSRLWRPMGWYSVRLWLDWSVLIVFSRHGGIKQPTNVLGSWILSGNLGWCVVAWHSDLFLSPPDWSRKKNQRQTSDLHSTPRLTLHPVIGASQVTKNNLRLACSAYQ